MEAEQHRQTRDRQPVFTLLIDNVSVRFKSLLDCEGFDEKVPIDSKRWVLLSDKTEKLVEKYCSRTIAALGGLVGWTILRSCSPPRR